VLTGRSAELLGALQRTLHRWNCLIDGDIVTFTLPGGSCQPPRRPPAWHDMLARMRDACHERGVASAVPLPTRGPRGADLTFSAVQALDPYLKDRRQHTTGAGFLAQPVVRFTGARDERGGLQPGYATSFVNTSIVQPIGSAAEHAALIDTWISVLSRLGLHARHITIGGSLAIWHREPVQGITLRFRHGQVEIGDAVLLWNAADPFLLATDIGSGIERLRWTITGLPWPQAVFGELSSHAGFGLLDAIRTATLLAGSGINPGPRGAGGALRRLLRTGEPPVAGLGMSRAVRSAHGFWSLFRPLPVPWPETCRIIENEVFTNDEQQSAWSRTRR
jgi:hypothetical protein